MDNYLTYEIACKRLNGQLIMLRCNLSLYTQSLSQGLVVMLGPIHPRTGTRVIGGGLMKVNYLLDCQIMMMKQNGGFSHGPMKNLK